MIAIRVLRARLMFLAAWFGLVSPAGESLSDSFSEEVLRVASDHSRMFDVHQQKYPSRREEFLFRRGTSLPA